MFARCVGLVAVTVLAVSLLAGCTAAGTSSDSTNDPTASASATVTPAASPSATGAATDGSGAAESAGLADATRACDILAAKNFVEPGVAEALSEASAAATLAAGADPKWQPLADSIAALAVDQADQKNSQASFQMHLDATVAGCNALGITIVTD